MKCGELGLLLRKSPKAQAKVPSLVENLNPPPPSVRKTQ
jgi:hypothetical protein